MKTLAFVSRHVPSMEQILLAKQYGFELVHVGDWDAFRPIPAEWTKFDGLCGVHPALFLNNLHYFKYFAVFKNSQRDGKFVLDGMTVWEKPEAYPDGVGLWAE